MAGPLVGGAMVVGTINEVAEARLLYMSNAVNAANAISYTFPGMRLGSGQTKKVVVCVNFGDGEGSGTPVTIDTATIAGVSASIAAVQNANASGDSQGSGIVVADINAATTMGDVVVAFRFSTSGSANSNRCGIVVYEMIGAASSTPTDTAVGSSADPLAVNCDIPANGCIVACSNCSDGTGATWTNVDEVVDQTVEANRPHSSAYRNVTTAEVNQTITVDWAGTPSEESIAVASWSP